ncbi:Uncharacterized protein dnm_078750 [Desulfonema magnum]|uniref:Uncharacterized protein n=1 Tax=Desulfonema magnum TaxID=45655 RepID=A0A975BU49_9BACT|nr:Uncharacterized protein dnm_078750 [Desulfonema magnum]
MRKLFFAAIAKNNFRTPDFITFYKNKNLAEDLRSFQHPGGLSAIL